MAKVGILTFQNTLNYGAALQCYALYHELESLGHEPVVIDYRSEQIARNEGLVWSWRHPRSLLRYLRRSSRMRGFERFRSQLRFTRPCTRGDISDVCRPLDFVVVGSDQVWNPRCMGDDPTYFLDFMDDPAKKKSYAVSTGGGAIPGTTFDVAQCLDGFSSLLLRERSGAEYVASIVSSGVEPRTVLDPTLLLHADDWSDLACKPVGVSDVDFVLFYVINEKEHSVEAARKLAKESETRLIELASGESRPLPGMEDALFLRAATPEGFLWLFSHASQAVVSSFHGVCFSILNHLDFYYSLGTAGAIGDNSRRIVDLVEALGISHRTVQDYLHGTAEPIDYTDVERRLDAMRAESVRLLAESLKSVSVATSKGGQE